MSNIKKELNSFEEYIKVYMKVIKIKSVNYKYYSKITSHEYDDCTIEQFLILYKLNRMKELGVISDAVSDKLNEILSIKNQIDNLIGKEASKVLYSNSNASNSLEELNKMSETIHNQLKKYHLTTEDLSFADMIDSIIKEENNIIGKEDKNVRVKRID